MKKLIIILSFIFMSNFTFSQEITGDWHGLLKAQGMSLRLIFHIENIEGAYKATMDSPDQGANGIPVTSVTLENDQLTLKVAPANIVYNGFVSNDSTIKGKFTQMGSEFPLDLSKKAIEKTKLNRPQEPKGELPYVAEEVTFENKEASVTLSGTLTIPDSTRPFPVAILISGSGPQNRDEEFLTHKPFLVLADYLTRQGIAVLRYDDRGFAQSTGDHNSATSLDFAQDVEAAVQFLKEREEIDENQIGLIGHSEGGLIAPIVASESKNIAFIVMLAGPGVSGEEISIQQVKTMGAMAGVTGDRLANEVATTKGMIDLVKKHYESGDLEEKLKEYLIKKMAEAGEVLQGMNEEEVAQRMIAQVNRPWYHYFIQHQPADYLKKVKCPVLAMNGDKDTQVTVDNLKPIEQALQEGGNQNYLIKEMKGMNHLFQECETGAMTEYTRIEETMSPIALKIISDWILSLN